jgi:hypothetical protein
MKKAKIMLSAIAVIAILSGTLAFKAHYKGSARTYYFCKTVAAATTGTCTTATILATQALSTVQLNGFSQFTTYATLSTLSTPCTIGDAPDGDCISPLFQIGNPQ